MLYMPVGKRRNFLYFVKLYLFIIDQDGLQQEIEAIICFSSAVVIKMVPQEDGVKFLTKVTVNIFDPEDGVATLFKKRKNTDRHFQKDMCV